MESSAGLGAALALVAEGPLPGALTPRPVSLRVGGPVLCVGGPCSRRGRPGEPRRGPAAGQEGAPVPGVQARRGGAQGALQGGGVAGVRWRAEEHPATVLHELGQAGQEVCVTGAAGPHAEPPAPGEHRGTTH